MKYQLIKVKEQLFFHSKRSTLPVLFCYTEGFEHLFLFKFN